MRAERGFSLLEVVVGMVVFSIVMVIVTQLVSVQARRSIDPVVQVRAAELGQSLMEEILTKAFDEASTRSGGFSRCNETLPCTVSGQLGPDPGESRSNFNDVDDYQGLSVIADSLGVALQSAERDLYQGYSVDVQVFYDDDQNGINDDDANGDGVNDTGTFTGNVKLVRVTVTTPQAEDLVFSALRWNY